MTDTDIIAETAEAAATAEPAAPARRQRKPDTGLIRPYRPKPADFRETFIRLGWQLEDHYNTNWRCIRRWVMEEGRTELLRARQEQRGRTRIKRTVEGVYHIGRRRVTAAAPDAGDA